MRATLFAIGLLASAGGIVHAQVEKPVVPGVANFAKVDPTVACAGATTPAGVAELKKLGYSAIVNLRLASEPGADVEAEAAAAKEAGIRFIHLPFNPSAPDRDVVEQFLKAIVDPVNQPTLIHCATGNRAAALLMIKRMVVDGWSPERASEEAAAAGLTNPALKQFALDYAAKVRPARTVYASPPRRQHARVRYSQDR